MKENTEWVLLDTETDGLDYPIHAVEVAAQRMRGTEKDGEPFRVFLNHNIPIPAFATAIHGYDRGFLEANGIDPREAYEQLRSYIESRPVTAHFLRYDWNAVLLPEWRRLRIPHAGQPGLCTWNLSRRVLPECRSHRLDLLREIYGLPTKGAHTAIGDIETVYLLLKGFVFPRLQQIGLRCYCDFLRFSLEKPLLKCHCLIQGKDYANELERLEFERKERQRKLQEIEEKQRLLESILAGEIPDVVGYLKKQKLITEDPEIVFKNHIFLFTGKMIWGSRSTAVPLIESLGGVFSDSKTVRSGLDYLVLGEDPEKGWAGRTGGKLADALWLKILNPDDKLCIVEESHFIDQMMAQIQAQVISGISNGEPVTTGSPSRIASPRPMPKKPKAKLPLSELTEATIRTRTRTGDTPLHIAAKKGKFNEIPAHLLTTQSFLETNNRQETPLHVAAMHGHLNRVPSEFLTEKTLTVFDRFGRTPLHSAADYRHVEQIPRSCLTPEILRLQTNNAGLQTVLHLAAATNTMSMIPQECITADLLQIKNGEGLTPLDLLKSCVAGEDNLTGLRSMGVTNSDTCPVVMDGVEYRNVAEANANLRQQSKTGL